MSNQKTPKKQTKKAQKPEKSQAEKGYNVSEGNKITTVYVNEGFHNEIKNRAKSLNMSVSKYFVYLAKRDLGQGGEFKISPSPAP